MIEVTRVYTIETTGIAKGKEEDIIPPEQAKVKIQNKIKNLLGCDDVLITNVQDFIREVDA